MKSYFTERLLGLSGELGQLSHSNLLEQCDSALNLLFAIDNDFKEQLRKHNFASPEDEIHYFRHQKPDLVCEIVYHHELYHMELGKPICIASRYTFYRKELEKIDWFFMENESFIRYIRSGSTEMDSFFFRRNNMHYKTIPESSYPLFDPVQTTNYDWKLGMLYAYERLAQHIYQWLEQLDPGKIDIPESVVASPPLLDTDKLLKSHQVERKLGISASTLQRLRRSGELPFVKIRTIIYYRESDVNALLDRDRDKQFDD